MAEGLDCISDSDKKDKPKKDKRKKEKLKKKKLKKEMKLAKLAAVSEPDQSASFDRLPSQFAASLPLTGPIPPWPVYSTTGEANQPGE
jgi:hypothetical protein